MGEEHTLAYSIIFIIGSQREIHVGLCDDLCIAPTQGVYMDQYQDELRAKIKLQFYFQYLTYSMLTLVWIEL